MNQRRSIQAHSAMQFERAHSAIDALKPSLTLSRRSPAWSGSVLRRTGEGLRCSRTLLRRPKFVIISTLPRLVVRGEVKVLAWLGLKGCGIVRKVIRLVNINVVFVLTRSDDTPVEWKWFIYNLFVDKSIYTSYCCDGVYSPTKLENHMHL